MENVKNLTNAINLLLAKQLKVLLLSVYVTTKTNKAKNQTKQL
jgi:hypothetical protein